MNSLREIPRKSTKAVLRFDALFLKLNVCGEERSAGVPANGVRQQICWCVEARFFSLSSRREERAGERRQLFSNSPLSGSLPARSSPREREGAPPLFPCQTLLASPPAARWKARIVEKIKRRFCLSYCCGRGCPRSEETVDGPAVKAQSFPGTPRGNNYM
jgi:hypothetical protein